VGVDLRLADSGTASRFFRRGGSRSRRGPGSTAGNKTTGTLEAGYNELVEKFILPAVRD
jgi:hypothetical protein